MGISLHSRALRAVVLACGLAWLLPVADGRAASLLSPAAAVMIRKSIEPFGQPTAFLAQGALRDKWLGVQRRIDDEMVQLAICEGDREGCVSPEALKLLAIVDTAKARDGRARLGEVNRAINLAIKPASDLALYGQIDVWSSPLATLARGAGDCEDYAIAKLVALRLAGVAQEDLRIVIMHDTLSGEDHAVTAARLDGHWLTLDNRRMAMVEDGDVRNVRPTFMIDQYGVNKYSDAPIVAAVALQSVAQAD
ncbi:transglutaminase-like cysteine peptidase [Bradyrhizobium jicamae]|uniref:transglutaminase-like cysteine peptidase n=1 Tax=Bradyrhizobium jicamae TaxID=280332 RepID=UPI001BA5B751|nr:transglutaminase-like cysteine peptidase [Bradyrhizobium jicamae]MBR0758012.1 transglutaminase-like cysteine peptidase [Bradyrhizobium jicamae]